MSLLSLTKKYLSRDAKPEKASKKKATKTDTKKAKKSDAKPEVAVSVLAMDIGLHPLVTEESMRANERNTIVFRVRPTATKTQIAKAVAEQYNTTVVSVRTANFRPKTRMRGNTVGNTNVWKKAYVTVNDIQSLIA